MTRLLLPTILLLLGCTPKDEDDTAADSGGADSGDSTDTTETGETGSDATVTITGPAGGDVYLSPTLTYEVTGLTLSADHLGGDAVDGQGHVHIKVDGEYVDATADTSYTLSLDQLSPGTHEVGAWLAGNDHVELGPHDEITLNVLDPSVTITGPRDGTTLDSRGVRVSFDSTDFTFDADEVGGLPFVGHGHYHLMVDGAYYDLGTDPNEAWFRHLSSGDHTLGVELVNNDHTSLTPPVLSEVAVTVAADASDIHLDTSAYTDPYDSATIPVTVSVDNLTLVAPSESPSNTPGEGHYHTYVDGVYMFPSANLTSYLVHQAPGAHVVTVALTSNDHTELGARDQYTVNVATDRPDITITSPASGDHVTSDFNLTVSPENFTFVDYNTHSTNEDGFGHYHVLIDGNYYALGTTNSTLVSGVPTGQHLLSVMLVQNDHSDREPMVVDEIPITIQ